MMTRMTCRQRAAGRHVADTPGAPMHELISRLPEFSSFVAGGAIREDGITTSNTGERHVIE
ncbi:MAG: hypothetical protein V4724_22150 [Pseudomonadota bacterium]